LRHTRREPLLFVDDLIDGKLEKEESDWTHLRIYVIFPVASSVARRSMLLLTPSVSGLFKWRQFEPEVILLAVGWYLRFSLFPFRTVTSRNSLLSVDC
jgi:hypothetical protein